MRRSQSDSAEVATPEPDLMSFRRQRRDQTSSLGSAKAVETNSLAKRSRQGDHHSIPMAHSFPYLGASLL